MGVQDGRPRRMRALFFFGCVWRGAEVGPTVKPVPMVENPGFVVVDDRGPSLLYGFSARPVPSGGV